MKADILIQGIAKRASSEKLIKSIIEPVKPKVVIPAHHDNFFRSLEEGYGPMPQVDPEEFEEVFKKTSKGVCLFYMSFYADTFSFPLPQK